MVIVEPSKVYLTDLLARRTLERQPTVAGAQSGVKRWVIEERPPSVPDVDYLLSARAHHGVDRFRSLLFGTVSNPELV